MIPRMPPLIPLNAGAPVHNQEQIEKIENTQRECMNKIPLQRQLWMNTKHSNMLTGFQCVSESQKPNALNAFVWDKGINQPNNIPEDDHEMTDVSDDDKNASNIPPSSNKSSYCDKQVQEMQWK